ncbi:MAG: hypothetical protein JNK05_31345 [Myxococcales bacterium]|nr:hypothetical protein [Myxococcales bacterium]
MQRLARSFASLLCLSTALSACAVGEGTPQQDAGRLDSGRDSAMDAVANDAPSIDSTTPPVDARTTDGATDTGVSTSCPLGQFRCGPRCVDIRSDPMHCGECDLPCVGVGGAVGTCVNGACVSTCMTNRGDCDGNAANGCEQDLTNSAAHCGACNRRCNLPNASSECRTGRCALLACNPGFADCNSNAADGCEQDTRTSPEHCGACVVSCARPNAMGVCTAGSCSIASCNAGFGDCDGNAANGCEQDTNGSNAHCGRCGSACTIANGTGGCAGGACRVASCGAGFGDCDRNAANGCEANLARDPANCGSCGNRPTESCNLADDNCNAVCDDTAGCRTAVHRSLHPSTGEHFYTTSLSEAMCCGFMLEHANFYYLYAAPAPGLVQFMRCIAGSKHFYTADPACEGTIIEGPMGYIAPSPVCGAVALYRTVHRSNGDHFYTTSAAERDAAVASGSYISEGIAGYVWTSPVGM